MYGTLAHRYTWLLWKHLKILKIHSLYAAKLLGYRWIDSHKDIYFFRLSERLQFNNSSISISHLNLRLPFRQIPSQFLPARRYASESNVSVHLPVTRQYCVKTKKDDFFMISSSSGSHMNLVFWCQISSPYSEGSPSRGLKQKWGGKIQPFSTSKHQYLKNGSRLGRSYY